MRIVIQRVQTASVTLKDTAEIVGHINKGLFILVGIKKGDSLKSAAASADKITKLRIMADEAGKMNLSVKEANAELLVVSQFTLLADTGGGNRPSFINAEEPQKARAIYERFVKALKENGLKVAEGSFGNYMQIDCILDGPVTIILEN